MNEKVKEKPIDCNCWYENQKGMSRKKIAEMSAAEIVWYIDHIAKDTQTHVLWEDCARWLDFKMREIKKFASFLEKKKPLKGGSVK